VLLTMAAAVAMPSVAQAQTIWAVGDGAGDGPEDDAVAARIAAEGPFDRLLYLGDVYDTGTATEFASFYTPSYGRFRSITSPTPGNHEWENRATGYDAYWGPGVRQPGGGHWYSYDLNGWHVVSLSSMESRGAGSPQHRWLQDDLARYPGTCTIAFTHHPRFSAGPDWNTRSLEPLFGALRGHAIALLAGHAHNYQRHHPTRGITQFVVGTGGRRVTDTDDFDPRLAAKNDTVHGALRMRLEPGRLAYEFVPVVGEPFDAGSIDCVTHTPAPARIRALRPRNRVRYPRLRTLRGRLANAHAVELRLVRRAQRRGPCQAFDGKRFRRESCSTRRRFEVDGRESWRLRVRRGLPPGGYRLTVYADAIDGTRASRTVRFRVGRQ
jgi:acid phosphatase type 7